MPITYTSNSIFTEGMAEVLVNPVNCVGVMGAGLALEFKKRFPDLQKPYQALCTGKILVPGKPAFARLYSEHWYGVVFFPTKNHWKDESRIQWIDEGLAVLRELINRRNIDSIAIPMLGCGLGGLEWPDVKALIEAHLSNLTCDVVVCGL